MKRWFVVATVLMLAWGAANVHAVQPAYEGQFGNPEEPALRIYKWTWLGLRKMALSTQEGLKAGIQKDPADAMCKGAKGAAKGSATLADHAARGIIFSPLPPKESLRKTETYEQKVLAALEKVDTDLQPAEQQPCAEGGDAAATDACAADKQEAGASEEKPVNYIMVKNKNTDVEKAQRKYVPDRAANRDRTKPGTGNLLKLAR